MHKLLPSVLALSAFCAPAAFAADAPDHRFAVTLGYAAQQLHGDALVPVELGDGYPVGSEVENGDDASAATLALNWYLTRNIALELWGATGSDNSVEIDVENGADVGVASYRTRPLALSVQYHFTDLPALGGMRLTPYVGLGYHHTDVSDVHSNAARTDVAGLAIDGGGGLAAAAGLDLALGERWFVRGDVRYLHWSAKSSANGLTLVDGDLDTLSYGASLGLRF